jgi:hypothetical protein
MGLYFELDKGVLPRQAETNLPGLDQVIREGRALKPPRPPPRVLSTCNICALRERNRDQYWGEANPVPA